MSGTNSTLQRLGAVIGVAIVTTVCTAAGGTNTPAAFTAGFRPALTIAAGLSLLGVCTALALRGRRTGRRRPPGRLTRPPELHCGTMMTDRTSPALRTALAYFEAWTRATTWTGR